MSRTHVFDLMVGDCPAMRTLFATIEKVAPTNLTVLILGETGTGKELVARSLHARSPRARGPFVALNCAAIPATLLESELFGFVKGAFTGAERNRVGTIERAHGGTLFLDEIAEMLPGAQAKLLRVLQDRRVRPLGASQERAVDVRVLAATHQDLQALVLARAFRPDLFHRLNEMTLSLPPLRERGEDVERIAAHVLQQLGSETGRTLRLSPAARQLLQAHSWPGNVRELENCLRRAATCSETTEIDVAAMRIQDAQAPLPLRLILEQATEAALRAALRRHAGRVEPAAQDLDVPVRELREMALRFRIPLDS